MVRLLTFFLTEIPSYIYMNRYEFINDVILDHLDDEIKSTDRSGVWRYLISFKVISIFPSTKGMWPSFRICCVQLRTLGSCPCTGFDTSALATSPSRTSSSLYFSIPMMTASDHLLISGMLSTTL